MLRLATITFFFLPFLLFAQKTYIIQGKIISSLEKEKLNNIPIVLLKQNPNINPPLFPIARATTDEQGGYFFENIENEEGSKYLIGALIQGNRIASKAITLGKTPVQILNIEFLAEKKKITLDTSLIEYTNRVLVFHLLKDKIRITEIIQIQNHSDQTIYSQDQPLKLLLPADYQNFSSFQIKEEILKVQIKEDYALLFFQVPPNKSELYVEYDLPFLGQLTYTHPSFSQENTPLNLVFDQRYLSVVALGEFLNFDLHGKYTIASFPQPPQKPVVLSIRSKILPQKKFWILAYIFAAVALLSILIFQYKKNKNDKKINHIKKVS